MSRSFCVRVEGASRQTPNMFTYTFAYTYDSNPYHLDEHYSPALEVTTSDTTYHTVDEAKVAFTEWFNKNEHGIRTKGVVLDADDNLDEVLSGFFKNQDTFMLIFTEIKPPNKKRKMETQDETSSSKKIC